MIGAINGTVLSGSAEPVMNAFVKLSWEGVFGGKLVRSEGLSPKKSGMKTW